MVIDTSAVLAILLAEPEAEGFADAIDSAESAHVSAASYLESAVVIDCRGDAFASREFDRFFQRSSISVEPVTFEQARIARRAYRNFGKGQHPAALNFGDCLSYALAKALDEPLLFKGDDFGRTDIEAATPK
jgi:ribonuclease VapC